MYDFRLSAPKNGPKLPEDRGTEESGLRKVKPFSLTEIWLSIPGAATCTLPGARTSGSDCGRPSGTAGLEAVLAPATPPMPSAKANPARAARGRWLRCAAKNGHHRPTAGFAVRPLAGPLGATRPGQCDPAWRRTGCAQQELHPGVAEQALRVEDDDHGASGRSRWPP